MKTLKKLILILIVFTSNITNAQETSILVFTKTAGYRHKSIEAGKEAVKKMSVENNWKVTFSEDSNLFNAQDLSKFDVLFFLNTTGDILNNQQQEAMKAFLSSGKGFVGTHSASDTEKDWIWYNEMIGAFFKSHPKPQKATLHIDKSFGHSAVNHLNNEEVFFDEWYNFTAPVKQHVNVLATLDETSYSGKRMGIKHPITWYHHYNGARVFYTGLGHTKESYSDERLVKQIIAGIEWAAGNTNINTITKKWTHLLKGDPTKNWDVFVGVPHKTVKNLPNINPTSNGISGTPLGLNNDPKNVVTYIKDKNNNNIVHISGEIYAGLATKQEYENYHLKLKVKWGTLKWEPRKDNKRDSGLLYHCVGEFGKFWNVWMRSQELQIQEGDMGDYYGLSGALSDIPSIKKNIDGKDVMVYNENGEYHHKNIKKSSDNEKKNGKWNTIELITYNGTSLHIVNGKVVLVAYNSRQKIGAQEIPLTRGKIEFQSEGAEVYYKDIKIKSINNIPKKYQKHLK